jgi:hypothetical protein
VEEFPTAAWFASLNRSWRDAEFDSAKHDRTVTVVFHFLDGPSEGPAAMTFTVDASGAGLVAGSNAVAPDLVVTLRYDDAALLARGELNAGRALREGRLKVRGDVNALTEFGAWIVASQRRTG